MKTYKVIKDGYQMFHIISPECGMLSGDDIENSMRHILVKGDEWVTCIDEDTGDEVMFCTRGVMGGDDSLGKFDMEGLEDYFIEITNQPNNEDEVGCQDGEDHSWVVSEMSSLIRGRTGSWSEAECTVCGLKKSNS